VGLPLGDQPAQLWRKRQHGGHIRLATQIGGALQLSRAAGLRPFQIRSDLPDELSLDRQLRAASLTEVSSYRSTAELTRAPFPDIQSVSRVSLTVNANPDCRANQSETLEPGCVTRTYGTLAFLLAIPEPSPSVMAVSRVLTRMPFEPIA
jgi:hypothetical protein